MIPQGTLRAIGDFLNPLDKMKMQQLKGAVRIIKDKLEAYNGFEKFIKTYGDSKANANTLKTQINTIIAS